jgi:ArsR family transcriptional regulator, arsenate/arsenite/antimonite-responsive transcriptional repressor
MKAESVTTGLELFFAALADKTRLRLLNLMLDGEVCVCFFAETLGTNNPKISLHLAYLKRAGLVASRRDGKWMHYRMARPEGAAGEIFDKLTEQMKKDDALRAERKHLANVCCARPVVQIAGARRNDREAVSV